MLLGILTAPLLACSVGGQYGHVSEVGFAPRPAIARTYPNFAGMATAFLNTELIRQCGKRPFQLETFDYGYSVEFRVSGLRNCVAKGYQLWELLDISFTRTGARLDEVHIVVDGRVAPGIGQPLASQFTKSMEPQFYQELSDFGEGLRTAFASFKERGVGQ